MELVLKRVDDINGGLLGRVNLINDEGESIFEAFSIENKVIGKEANKDFAIPNGEYKLYETYSPKFNKTLDLLMGKHMPMIGVYNDVVPKSRRILIHWGNTHKDTLGCILFGKVYDENGIYSSRVKCKEFYELMSTLKISDIKLIIDDIRLERVK